MVLQSKWRENFLNCRQCKRRLVKFVGNYFLTNGGTYLHENQTLYVAGAFDGEITDTAWFIKGKNKAEPDPSFSCNAEETDTRLWLHVKNTDCTRVLVMSPDTDVYNIGLPLQCIQEKEVFVQVSNYSARELKLLNMTNLIRVLNCDPDLGHINCTQLPQILQTLYVITGCDYISFFSQIGKATFLRYFFQYAPFITGSESTEMGSLADVDLENGKYKHGYLAFTRLVGTVFFKKHSSGFDTQSPAIHYSKFDQQGRTVEEQHRKWIEDIRQTIWYRTKFENEVIPSHDALFLHWQRSCWILHMWQQADCSEMVLLPITRYGWSIVEGKLTVVWDSEVNIRAVKERVCILTRGCKCRTGCATNRCSCKKMGISALQAASV